MYSLLFVCRQNRFRSPMAEGLFLNKLKAAAKDQDWLVASAGTWTEDGQPAMSGAMVEMAKRGIDISRHRSKLVNKTMLDSYHLILTMDKNQKEALCLEFPEAAGRIYLLTEMTGEDWEVSDFDGLTMAPYDRVARDIENLVERGFEKIQRLAGEAQE